jgi:hypothetical protein
MIFEDLLPYIIPSYSSSFSTHFALRALGGLPRPIHSEAPITS